METRRVTIVVEQIEGSRIHPQDVQVAGLYQVEVDSTLSDGHAAREALDSFHLRTPIKMLENYTIYAQDPLTHLQMSEEPLQEDESASAEAYCRKVSL